MFEVASPAETAQPALRRVPDIIVTGSYLAFGSLLVREVGRAVPVTNHHLPDRGISLSNSLLAAFGFVADFS